MTVNTNRFINDEAAVKRCMSALIFEDDSFLILPYLPIHSLEVYWFHLDPSLTIQTHNRYSQTEAIFGKRNAVPFSTTAVYSDICLYWSWCLRATRKSMSQTSFNKSVLCESMRNKLFTGQTKQLFYVCFEKLWIKSNPTGPPKLATTFKGASVHSQAWFQLL